MKKFLFFDLDGTLADTDRDIRGAWKLALAEMNIDCPNFDKDFIAGPSIEKMAQILFPDRYTDALGSELRARFGAHYDNDGFPTTREYPGVMDVIRALKAKGCRVFIVTNKRMAGASKMSVKFSWDKVFEKLYTGDMHMDNPAIGKMNKAKLLAFVMKEVGAAPADCLMIGDTINDFEAAKANGIESVAVTWGYGNKSDFALAGRVICAAEELLSL